jgi:uncharacterized protein (TIGR02598 family)
MSPTIRRLFPRPTSHLRGDGFSLVEVVIALGLVSFAVLAMIGLMASGLTTVRNSMDQTVQAQILRSIGARSVVANFTDLAVSTPLMFDEQGQPTDDSNLARFYVTVTTNTPIFPGSTNLPANAWTNVATRLRVEIVSKPTPDVPGITNFHTLSVANSGK